MALGTAHNMAMCTQLFKTCVPSLVRLQWLYKAGFLDFTSPDLPVVLKDALTQLPKPFFFLNRCFYL